MNMPSVPTIGFTDAAFRIVPFLFWSLGLHVGYKVSAPVLGANIWCSFQFNDTYWKDADNK